MKLLLLGMHGQLGWELQRSLAPLGEVVTLGRQGNPRHPGLVGDLTDADGLGRTVAAVRPDVIVNAAAHTAVDAAESEPDLCRLINSTAPAVLARCAAASGALLVHYSTDYVFDGGGSTPWVETDAPSPLNVYGDTKLAGEQAIIASACTHLIFRTSWVYGARGNNFARTMLRLAQERNSLSVVDDQVGAPTGADLLADVTAHAIRAVRQQSRRQGLYHVTAAGETSWCGYARFVLQTAHARGRSLKILPEGVHAVPSSAYPTQAVRPLNSRLDCSRVQSTFGLRMPPWQDGVERLITTLL